MSKADEMFEKLGYEKDNYDQNSYFNVITPFKHQLDITFIDGDIILSKTDYDENGNLENNTIYLNKEVLQAINEKVKELGWNE